MTAQARTTASGITSDTITPLITYFTGLTYPNPVAGLPTCDAEGEALVANSNGEDAGYSCQFGNPDAGVYNLWITYWNPNYCRTC